MRTHRTVTLRDRRWLPRLAVVIGVSLAPLEPSATVSRLAAQSILPPSAPTIVVAPRVEIAVAAVADRGGNDDRSVPPPPDDATAAKAYAVFDQACAQCHQTGRRKGTAGGGGLDRILALDDLAADPSLVRPGLPDASRVYDVLLRRHAPLALAGLPISNAPKDTALKEPAGKEMAAKDSPAKEVGERGWPSSTEIQAVRDWIERLPQADAAPRCGNRLPITPDQIATEITRIVTETPTTLQPGLRFLSLANLHNGCVSDAEIESYRQAVVLLLNSLSWAERPQKIRASGPGDVVMAFNLRDVMWVPAHWQRLAGLYPHASALDAPLDEAVFKLVETTTPVLRADWFAATAGSVPHYYDLIGMPTRMRDLETILIVNSSNLVLRGAAVRAGIEFSQITNGPRMVERLPARTGSLWRAYDIDGRRPGDGVLATPVGPDTVGAIERVFKPTGARVLFSSPNGFMMFGQFDQAGERLPAHGSGVREGESDRGLHPHDDVALGCIGCHMRGPLGVRDEVRALAFKDTTAKPVRDAIVMLHPEQTSIDGLIAEDRDRVAKAIADAGIDARRTVRGHSPLASLVQRYRSGGDIEVIAVEAGTTREAIWRSVADGDQEVRDIVLRAYTGRVGRLEINRVLAAVAPAARGVSQLQNQAATAAAASPDAMSDVTAKPAPAPASGAAPVPSPGAGAVPAKAQSVDLMLWPDTPEFRIGDLAAFVARASSDCFLTLVGVDNRGIATVLFPNDFEPDNRVLAGKRVKIPSDTAAYQFRLKEAGSEVVVGMCSTQARTFAGIEHDFERQRFTVLGNWSVFIADQLSLVEKSEAEAPVKARAKGSKERSDKPDPPTIASNYGHAAIRYEILPRRE